MIERSDSFANKVGGSCPSGPAAQGADEIPRASASFQRTSGAVSFGAT